MRRAFEAKRTEQVVERLKQNSKNLCQCLRCLFLPFITLSINQMENKCKFLIIKKVAKLTVSTCFCSDL